MTQKEVGKPTHRRVPVGMSPGPQPDRLVAPGQQDCSGAARAQRHTPKPVQKALSRPHSGHVHVSSRQLEQKSQRAVMEERWSNVLSSKRLEASRQLCSKYAASKPKPDSVGRVRCGREPGDGPQGWVRHGPCETREQVGRVRCGTSFRRRGGA